MATIVTKYSVGDKVYHASTIVARKRHPCPDCLGSREWEAISPAGGKFKFACPRCSASYNSDRDLMLDYQAHTPFVQRLTIGSVQYNTAKGSYDEGARYMCTETGVGSGSVYDEARLFETEAAALVAAEAMATAANSSVEWIVKLYDKSLKISDYQLESAALKLAAEQRSRASSMLWNLNGLFDDIEKAEGKDEIIEAIKDYKDFNWQRDKDSAAKEVGDV